MQRIAGRLKEDEDRHYGIGLAGYFIEGVPYCASALYVSRHATLEIQINDTGFSCIAFFPPELLVPSTVQTQKIRTVQLEGNSVDLVQVHLEARYRDIFSVREFVRREQHSLFFDRDAMARLSAFRTEAEQWCARRKADQ